MPRRWLGLFAIVACAVVACPVVDGAVVDGASVAEGASKAPVPPIAELLAIGLPALSRGDAEAAATLWDCEAEHWEGQEGVEASRFAGWSYALASAAFEKANRRLAYQTWPLAISRLTGANSRWRDEQERFRDWLTMPEVEPLGALARAIEEALQLAEFAGPSQGLGDSWWGAEPATVADSVPRDDKEDRLARSIVARRAVGAEPHAEQVSAEMPTPLPAPQSADSPAPSEVGFEPTDPRLLPQGRAEDEWLESVAPRESEPPKVARLATGLTQEDRALIEAAWAYFVRNRQPTGLVNAVDGYPYATLWDVASTLAAIHAAHRLSIIPSDEAIGWLEVLLRTLLDMPLYRGELPNREYDTRDASIATTGKRKLAGGSGWSALDLGRMLIWLRVIHGAYPSLQPLIVTMVEAWDLRRLSKDGQLNGVMFTGSHEFLRQEGRLGYEQYAATGFRLWDRPLPGSEDYDQIEVGLVDAVEVPFDARNLAFLTSDPFLLGALELGGIDPGFRALTETLFAVQLARWQREGILTAAGEDALDRYPWFVYNNILFEGEAWRSVSHRGRDQEGLFGWSAKAALGWWALGYDPAYGAQLRKSVQGLLLPGRGVHAGRLDNGTVNRSLNVNTNAVILEAMLFVEEGGTPFLSVQQAPEQ